MKLYSYFRSSAAYRARIALHLKGLAFDYVPVHLRKGEQNAQAYRALNRQALVPTLIDGDTAVTQSLAIIEYLDERHPEPPLLPSAPAGRARVRAIALAICCDIHPLNNLRVLRYLVHTLKIGEEAKDAWYRSSPMRGAPTFRSTAIRRCCASMQLAGRWMPSPALRPIASQTPIQAREVLRSS